MTDQGPSEEFCPYLDAIRKAQLSAKSPPPAMRVITSNEVVIADELRQRLFGATVPAAARITLQNDQIFGVRVFSESGDAIREREPVLWQRCVLEGRLVYMGAPKGHLWSEGLRIFVSG